MWRKFAIIVLLVAVLVLIGNWLLRRALGALDWPVDGPVTSGFGNRTNPVTHEKNKFHNGIDIAAHSGTPIVAPAAGTVIARDNDSISGNYLKIQHFGGIITSYSHLSAFSVSEGAIVRRGQKIGEVGATGRATGPHLHFNVRNRAGDFVDPLIYLV